MPTMSFANGRSGLSAASASHGSTGDSMRCNGTRPAFLRNSVIVAAHPDDELLWFGSVLKDVERVILVFRRFWGDSELGARRRAALDQHPHPRITCLDIDEAGSFGCADWKNPRPDDVGLAFSFSADLRSAKRRIKRAISAVSGSDPAPSFSVAADYRRNYAMIRSRLADQLLAGMNVFTHAPWGEYGHEDHVQVYRVLESLRDEIGFTLWVSNYCTERSFPLAARYFPATPVSYVRLPVDPDYCEQVAEVYRRTGCWTWTDDWAWFDDECFMEAPRSREQHPVPQRHLMPLNMFAIGG